MADLDGRDRDVLHALVNGRANPKLIREETGLDKGDTNTVLVRLGRLGHVRQIERGLYEITEQGREEIGISERTVDADAVEKALDDIEAAAERGDGQALQDALRRAREAIDE